MKTFVLVAYILIIVTMVYSVNIEKLQTFYSIFTKCADQLHLPRKPNPQTFGCMFHKYGLIDEMGMVRKYEMGQYLKDLVSDPYNLAQAQHRLKFCFNYGAAGRTNYENTMRIIECSVSLMEFIDKL